MKKIRIYQLDENNEKARSLMFLGYYEVKRELKLDLYKVVYDGEIGDSLDLDDIYQRFNIGRKPEGYKGHSLSTSDIVYIDEKFWFCDSYGWIEVKWKQFLIKANAEIVAKAACVGDLVEKADAFEKTIKGRYKREMCKFDEPDGMYLGIHFTLFDEDDKPRNTIKFSMKDVPQEEVA